MKKSILMTAALVMLAGGLSAATAFIQTADGRVQRAHAVLTDTVFGTTWEIERGRQGTRLRPWEVTHVRFDEVRGMDEYNSLGRRLAAGQASLGPKMVEDAESFLRGEPPAGLSDADWRNVQHGARFYRAQGLRLQGKHDEAIAAFDEFFREAEQRPAAATGTALPFTSTVTGRSMPNAMGLHRLYLDGLEAYSLCLLRAGHSEDAREKAIKGLQSLTTGLAQRTGENQYHNWTIRALRGIAQHYEDAGEYEDARQAWDDIRVAAVLANAGRRSRASIEAQLKVGFMEVQAGKLSEARSSFLTAIRNWENNHNAQRASEPRDWMSSDLAYETAGSYVGQGMVEAAGARDAEGWSRALRSFSMALAIFQADEEIRSMALLGAANASARLADLNAASPQVANNHARLADRYLSELVNLMPSSRAARDKLVGEIRDLVSKHRNGD
jgi:tetratricopeptide (TPR) repeat protein